MPTKIALVALVALALAGTTLAGCGGAKADTASDAAATAPAASAAPAGNGVVELPAAEIVTRAKAAVAAAKSVRVKGTMYDGDQESTIDLKSSGTDFIAEIGMGGAAKAELLQVEGKKYFRPNEAFWVMLTNAEQGKVIAAAYGKKWIAGAEKDQSFAELFSLGNVDDLLTPDGTVSKGEQKEIAGTPAIGLKDSTDAESTLYVATTGEPYVLQLAGKKNSGLTFSSYGETFPEIAAPAAGEVVQLKK